jgi:hypothetical protein
VTDLFEEVEGQLRSERYRTMALKAAPWVTGVLAAALIAAVGVWGWQKYQDQAIAKDSEIYADALQAFTEGDGAKADKLWGQVAQSPAKGYKSLALMQLGGLRLGENKTAEAVKLFDQAAEAAPSPVIGDAARLKAAFALVDTKPYKDIEARLTPLMADGRPYRVAAREALAFAKLQAGDTAGARTEFSVLSQMLDSAPTARERANAAIQLIDSGSAKAVPGAVKAAAALPPQAPALPAAPISAAPQPASGPQ